MFNLDVNKKNIDFVSGSVLVFTGVRTCQ